VSCVVFPYPSPTSIANAPANLLKPRVHTVETLKRDYGLLTERKRKADGELGMLSTEELTDLLRRHNSGARKVVFGREMKDDRREHLFNLNRALTAASSTSRSRLLLIVVQMKMEYIS